MAVCRRPKRPRPRRSRGRAAEAVHGKDPTLVRARPRRPPPTRRSESGPRPATVRFQASFAPQPDRPGPQSQSLSRSYGSDLPTSLTYIVLSARGCSPWRPAADMGTTRHENQAVSLGFSRAGGSAPDTARAAVLYGAAAPISGRADSRVSAPYQEKRTLPGAPADVSEFVCVAAPAARGSDLRARVREY